MALKVFTADQIQKAVGVDVSRLHYSDDKTQAWFNLSPVYGITLAQLNKISTLFKAEHVDIVGNDVGGCSTCGPDIAYEITVKENDGRQ